jgi:hypothetical protein
MTLEQEIDQLKKQAAEAIDHAARCDKSLSQEEDQAVLRLLDQAHGLEQQLARLKRKKAESLHSRN